MSTTCLDIRDDLVCHIPGMIFVYQSVALPPLAAPAQIWKPTTANINGSATTAAAASALIHLGSALLVFLIQTLEKESGNQ